MRERTRGRGRARGPCSGFRTKRSKNIFARTIRRTRNTWLASDARLETASGSIRLYRIGDQTMRHRSFAWFALGFGLLVAAAPVMAHHSFAAEYDSKKPVTLKGIVTKVDWTNPHVYFYMDVTDDGGVTTNWAF